MASTPAAHLLVEADRAQRAFLARRLAPLGLYVGQEQVLMRLWEKDGASQAELLGMLGCAAPTLTKAVQRLERAGLVRREREGRSRVSHVYLTQAGWDLQRPVEQAWAAAGHRLASAMTADQFEAFTASLRKVSQAFTD